MTHSPIRADDRRVRSRLVLRAHGDDGLSAVLDVWHRASLIAHLSADFLDRERRLIAERWIPIADTTVFVADGSDRHLGDETGHPELRLRDEPRRTG